MPAEPASDLAELRPISIMPRKRHLSSSVKWLYLVPMAIPDIAGVALGL